MTMFHTNNYNFLVVESTFEKRYNFTEHLIPKNSTKLIESMMSNGENMTDDVLQHMNNKTVDKVRQFSLEKLAMSKVAILIIEAAEALGYTTLGTQNPAAKVFYMLALHLQKARPSEGETANHNVTKRTSHQQEQTDTTAAFYPNFI